jgi:hypothetical protein
MPRVFSSFTLPIDASFASILGLDGATVISLVPLSNSVNYLGVRPGSTGTAVRLQALGSDTNIGLRIDTKGTGKFTIGVDEVLTTATSGVADVNSRVQVALEGSLVATRRQINFTTGTDTTFSIADDAGNERVDVEINSTSREWFSVSRLASDGTTTSATNSDTGLSFSIGSSEAWSFTFQAFTKCSTANGHKWGLDVPTGATIEAVIRGSRATAAAIISDSITSDDAQSTTFGTGTYTSGGYIEVVGTVLNSTTSGSVKLRYASATAGDTTTIKAGSFVEATRIS